MPQKKESQYKPGEAGTGRVKQSDLAERPGRSGDNAKKAIAARKALKDAYQKRQQKQQKKKVTEPRVLQPWCTDNCTDPDCPKRHPVRPCIHDKWNPMSGMKPQRHLLCARHCTAIGCQFLHYCRNQMFKGFCDEPNCRMEHWEMKCPVAPVPSMDEFPPMSG